MSTNNYKFRQTEIGEIPEDWSVKRLDEMCILQRGFDLPHDKRIAGEISIIASNGFAGYHNVAKVKGPGVTTGRSGKLGNSFYIEKDFWPLNTSLWVKDFKKNNPFFIYLLLSQIDFSSFNAGSSVPTLNRNHVHSLIVCCPPKKQQEQISTIIQSLDGKIELNQKTIKTSEEIGQALFKRWFVDFDFPNEKGEPYKSSGGEMVESELGEIPKGWKCSTIGNELKTYLGGTPSRENISFWENGTINWINSGKVNEFRIISPSEKITEEATKKSATKLLSKGTVVLAITGATLGQYSLLEIDSCFNQSVVGITESTKLKKEYIYYWVSNTINDLINSQTGGAQQHINKQVVDSHKLLIPQESILEKYYLLVELIFQQISNKCVEIKDLTETRDLLLPKLLSGKIRIN